MQIKFLKPMSWFFHCKISFFSILRLKFRFKKIKKTYLDIGLKLIFFPKHNRKILIFFVILISFCKQGWWLFRINKIVLLIFRYMKINFQLHLRCWAFFRFRFPFEKKDALCVFNWISFLFFILPVNYQFFSSLIKFN